MGLTMQDLDNMDFGFVMDMLTEAGNDHFDYAELAEQSDFDSF